MARIIVGKENAAEVGMTVEDDAEHVECLALVPDGGRPDRRNGGNRRAGRRDFHLHGNLVALCHGGEMVHHTERLLRVIDAAQAHEGVEREIAVIAQEERRVGDRGGGKLDERIDHALDLRFEDPFAELRFQFLRNFLGGHEQGVMRSSSQGSRRGFSPAT